MKKVFSKIEENKNDKKNKLLASSFELFTKKGVNDTSVEEITKKAGLAKGTFYLYFKDKYELQDRLITKKSEQLFNEAIKKVSSMKVNNFDDEIIFIIDYIIDKLNKNKILLKFISKNLSWGLYNKKVIKLIGEDEIGLKKLFIDKIKESKKELKNPEVTLYMIVELVGSTCFSSIINKEPLPIEEYKSYLYSAVRALLNEK